MRFADITDGLSNTALFAETVLGWGVNDTMGTVTLRAVVPNPKGELMPGMYVQALLLQLTGLHLPVWLQGAYDPANPGSGKVFDVIVAGVSLVTNYRSSFGQEIARGGSDGLIRSLEERNRALAEQQGMSQAGAGRGA